MMEEFPNDDEFEDNEGWLSMIHDMDLDSGGDTTIVENQYLIDDVSINFPYKAYDSQMQMMKKIIAGVKNGENCLLESPTGTGKTAALLCSLLAWQNKCREDGDYGWEIGKTDSEAKSCTCGFVKGGDTYILQMVSNVKYNKDIELGRFSREPNTEVLSETTNFTPPESLSPMKLTPEESFVRSRISSQYIGVSPKRKAVDMDQCCSSCSMSSPKKQKPPDCYGVDEIRNLDQLCRFCIRTNFKESRPPRIYYATRTHSQIKQVVKQLKNSHYNHTKMTILASRAQTCIRSETKLTPSVDDDCKRLRKGSAHNRNHPGNEPVEECGYFPHAGSMEYSRSCNDELNVAWDLDDIAAFGKLCGSCPFYGTRKLQDNADIVFCSYNYLVHPSIRKNSNIILPNSVIVFDEAHNIEELCREIASRKLCLDRINKDIVPAFDKALQFEKISQPQRIAVQKYLNIFIKFGNWITEQCSSWKCDNRTKQCQKVLNDSELLEAFTDLGFGPEDLSDHEACMPVLENEKGEENIEVDIEDLHSTSQSRKPKVFKVKDVALRFLRQLLQSLKFLFHTNGPRYGDYKAVLVKKNISVFGKPEYRHEFHLLCLNPAIVFAILKNCAHTIIVTSGTLSPLDSFESELDTKFRQQLTAPHVIGEKQVWAGVATCGVDNVDLSLAYQSQDVPEIQDRIGKAIVSICQIVPRGVLVFFPSYGFMEKLCKRWISHPPDNPIFNQLVQRKKIFLEQSGDIDVFKRTMMNYRNHISEDPQNGCVWFAVFRGKVSEGVDFKDDQARAVVTVGIPFLSAMDVFVVQKRAYNDKHKATRKVLGGWDWYQVQAFRAMNQAFGRCVRDENDWGALILIDWRLSQPYNKNKISSWVRKHLNVYKDFGSLRSSLEEFITRSTSFPVHRNNVPLNEGRNQEIESGDKELFPEDIPTQIVERRNSIQNVFEQPTQVIFEDGALPTRDEQLTQEIDETQRSNDRNFNEQSTQVIPAQCSEQSDEDIESRIDEDIEPRIDEDIESRIDDDDDSD